MNGSILREGSSPSCRGISVATASTHPSLTLPSKGAAGGTLSRRAQRKPGWSAVRAWASRRGSGSSQAARRYGACSSSRLASRWHIWSRSATLLNLPRSKMRCRMVRFAGKLQSSRRRRDAGAAVGLETAASAGACTVVFRRESGVGCGRSGV